MQYASNYGSLLKQPVIKQRYFLPGLFFFVGLAFYFSASMQVVSRDRAVVATLTSEVASLNATDAGLSNGLAQWLVEVRRLLPVMRLYYSPTTGTLDEPFATLARKAEQSAMVAPADQVNLRQQLVLAEVALRRQQHHLNDSHLRQTLFFYLCLAGFVGWIVLALMRNRYAYLAQPLQRLMADAYLFSHAPVAVALSDANDRYLRVNPVFSKMTGFEIADLPAQPANEQAPKGMRESLAEHGLWSGEMSLRCSDGSMRNEKMLRLVVGDDPQRPAGYLTVSVDPVVSDDEKQLMLWQAHHDSLTKLPNANLLHERLVRGLSAAQVEDKLGALISIDIDSFQHVNDSVGHLQADRILTDAAYRFAMCARDSDTVARTGGDDFVIAMLDIDSVEEAEQTARAVIESMAPPFYCDEREIFLTASAGVTIYPQDGLDRGELLQKADAARIQAKKQGGNQLAFFEQQMNSKAARRLEIETHLRTAVARGELELHYQPIVDCQADRVYGAEALLRWHNASLGQVSPAEFIPVAEQSGLITEIGDWVIDTVSTQLARWRSDADWPGLQVSLNISARQFAVEERAQALLESLKAVPHEQLAVELTESALVTDDPGTALLLKGLKEHGIRIGLDDFGTGYSSIGYLRDYDFDVIKIDKSFIDGISSSKQMGVVASIIAMGRIMGMRIVAEGVEEEAQVEILKRIGCDYIQGYFYSKPLPLDEFEMFVRKGL